MMVFFDGDGALSSGSRLRDDGPAATSLRGPVWSGTRGRDDAAPDCGS
jgi:hypothetical protein